MAVCSRVFPPLDPAFTPVTTMRNNAPPFPSGIDGKLTHVKTLTSAVTTAWGVDWDETFIARDLMQNFFDANRNRLCDVTVRLNGKDVSISAPATFNLERLFYLGSEKGSDDIGHYGEGFKVAATCLLRDHSVDVVAASNRDVLRIRIADTAVPETDLYPVEYDFFACDQSIDGTSLLLRGCSPKLAKALQQGLNHFFHENNPLLGAKRWEDYSGAFSVYDSTDGNGHVFYRKLKRGEFEGIPLVLVIDKEYGAIEKKIKHDRDRNAFGDQVMRMFFNHFARYGLKTHEQAMRLVLEKANHHWVKGHPLLSEIADRVWPSWSLAKGREMFGDGYFAQSTSRDPAEQLQFDALERKWREAGKTCLPQYFKKFGVLNAQQHLADLKEKAAEEARKNHHRLPSPVPTSFWPNWTKRRATRCLGTSAASAPSRSGPRTRRCSQSNSAAASPQGICLRSPDTTPICASSSTATRAGHSRSAPFRRL